MAILGHHIRLGYVNRNRLTAMAWEKAVQERGKVRYIRDQCFRAFDCKLLKLIVFS